jgi:Protein of unknown function (DUF2950)
MNVRSTIFCLLLACCATAARDAAAGTAAVPQMPKSASGQTFATASAAVTALIDALRGDKPGAVQSVLGPGSDKLVRSGDPYSDRAERQRFLDAYDAQHKLVAAAPDRVVLDVGKHDWPFPIPLVEAGERWHFDTAAGAEELVDRRIGRNEIAAIRTALTYVEAQKAFYAMSGQEGHAEYAQHLVSAPGKRDGLYWPVAAGEPESPLAPLMAQAQEEGYPGARVAGKPVPYHGYFFRILKGQGAASPEGALGYVSEGRMTKGFGLIAWPASFAVSGIMTFVVNQDGIVFQKDLGPDTAAIAQRITLFDPDLSWARIDIVN